ncbi:hypothetical protein V6L77_00690 [Pannonibacter sp. Pt2-lr]
MILDEFAFHDDAAELLKAAMALLIWGGRVLVISTHNGVDNPFNELLTEIRSGKRPGAVVRVTFDDALEQGLYQRICLVTGKTWSPQAEADWRDQIRRIYGSAADEELDCIPSMGTGVYLTTAQIEAATHAAPVLRLTCPAGFELLPEAQRIAYVNDWLSEHADPVLKTLDKTLRHSYGFDFARSGDLSVFLPVAQGRTWCGGCRSRSSCAMCHSSSKSSCCIMSLTGCRGSTRANMMRAAMASIWPRWHSRNMASVSRR